MHYLVLFLFKYLKMVFWRKYILFRNFEFSNTIKDVIIQNKKSKSKIFSWTFSQLIHFVLSLLPYVKKCVLQNFLSNFVDGPSIEEIFFA